MPLRPPNDDAGLSPYQRALLRVPVSATVTLARTRLPVSRIIELAPGTVLRFGESSTSALELRLGGQAIARGHGLEMLTGLGFVVTSLVPRTGLPQRAPTAA